MYKVYDLILSVGVMVGMIYDILFIFFLLLEYRRSIKVYYNMILWNFDILNRLSFLDLECYKFTRCAVIFKVVDSFIDAVYSSLHNHESFNHVTTEFVNSFTKNRCLLGLYLLAHVKLPP